MKFIYHKSSTKGGVYKITNIANEKVYFGSTNLFSKRSNTHRRTLEENIHFNWHLQASFNKWGTDCFIFEVIELVQGNKLARTTVEQKYINEYLDKWHRCYNSVKNVIQADHKENFEHISLTQSEIKKAFYKTEAGQELVQKLADNKRGKTYEEMFGEERAAEIKQTIRDNKLIEMNRPEVKENLRQQLLGVSFVERFGAVRAEEIKQKRSAGRKGKYAGKDSSGFRIIENIKLQAPNGDIYTRLEGIGDFARSHNLTPNSFSELLSGKLKSHRGWRLIK